MRGSAVRRKSRGANFPVPRRLSIAGNQNGESSLVAASVSAVIPGKRSAPRPTTCAEKPPPRRPSFLLAEELQYDGSALQQPRESAAHLAAEAPRPVSPEPTPALCSCSTKRLNLSPEFVVVECLAVRLNQRRCARAEFSVMRDGAECRTRIRAHRPTLPTRLGAENDCLASNAWLQAVLHKQELYMRVRAFPVDFHPGERRFKEPSTYEWSPKFGLVRRIDERGCSIE